MRKLTLFLLLLLVPGCAVHQHRFKVTVMSALIDATRPDGQPWHVKPPNPAVPFAVGLLGLALGVPRPIVAAAGQLLSGDTRHPHPSPEVWLDIAGVRYRTFPATRSLTPEWQYPFALDSHGLRRATPVSISVIDAEDGTPIGTKQLSLATLLSGSSVSLSNVGSVKSLLLRVEPLPEQPQSKIYKFVVPVATRLEELASHLDEPLPAEDAWRGIPLLNGDVVRIRARGQICPSSWNRDRCSGPEGFAHDWREYNRSEFRDQPHASLVGMYADQAIFVGSKTIFEAGRSGMLLLGVNDTDVGNNEGAFQVVVEVNPCYRSSRIV